MSLPQLDLIFFLLLNVADNKTKIAGLLKLEGLHGLLLFAPKASLVLPLA